jgi:hypothetical protein
MKGLAWEEKQNEKRMFFTRPIGWQYIHKIHKSIACDELKLRNTMQNTSLKQQREIL